MKIRKHSIAIPVDGGLVERPAPGAAPTAFRIWAAGENRSDDGSIYFTEASAKALIDEQTARNHIYSIDFDHLSLTTDRPADAGRAAGWHRLAIRPDANGKSELWAVDIEWCVDTKAGLEQQPPLWRFYSPAFVTDSKGEVTSYVNFALCINPLTHDLPSLATIKHKESRTMTKHEAALNALAVLADGEASDDDKKAAKAAIKAYADGLEGDEEKKDGDKPDEEEKKSAEGDADEEEKKEAKAHSAKPVPGLALAKDVIELRTQIEESEKAQLLEARKSDLAESVYKFCKSQPLSIVKGLLAATPKQMAKREDKATPVKPETPATDEASVIDRVLGVRSADGPLGLGEVDKSLNVRHLHSMTPSQARARLATKKGS